MLLQQAVLQHLQEIPVKYYFKMPRTFAISSSSIFLAYLKTKHHKKPVCCDSAVMTLSLEKSSSHISLHAQVTPKFLPEASARFLMF